MRGGVRERTPGVWEVRFESGRDPGTGRRRQVSRTVRGSEGEALRVLAALLGDADAGRVFGASATVGQLTDEWLAIAGRTLSPTTVRRYRGVLERHVVPALGCRQVGEVDARDLDRLYQALSTQRGLAPSSVCQVQAVLSRAFRLAVRWGWVDSSPAEGATPPRRPRSPVDPPEAREVAQLIDHAARTDPAFGRFLHVATATGARRGELCALRWRHLDTANASLVVEASLIELTGGLAERHAKSHATRRIALDSGTMAVLAAQRRHAAGLARRAGVALTEHGFVFSSTPGGLSPWTPDFVTRRFHALRELVGARPFRLQDLRHFAAAHLLVAGVPVRTVSSRLGHVSTSATRTAYAAFIDPRDRRAADVLGDLLPK
ncbi:MAG TPA: tyrosine-type recombinase/integrase [Acidimicrobiales bacterium]|nr:tyrosine-type recombinase/integrase [Acidimicrobiales bacterium]